MLSEEKRVFYGLPIAGRGERELDPGTVSDLLVHQVDDGRFISLSRARCLLARPI